MKVTLEQSKDEVQIIVRDTGQGISREFLPFVFERFRQADGSSTRAHDGLGLGLAIVRHLAELHGGSVHAASEGEDKGSTFTLTLPLSLVAKTPQETTHEKTNENNPNKDFNPGLDGVRVLIVDDDVDTCEMLNYVLNQWGAVAKASTSVSEAFASLNDWKPDVLLTDINMPGEDGYSLISRLRSLTPEKGASIPAIALTAMARPEDSEQALSAGFHLHLSKPINIEELAGAIVNLTKNLNKQICYNETIYS